MLDRVAAELDSRHIRVVRASGAAPGGLGLLGLVAQVAGRADPAALQDEDRERAFETLTELDDGFGRIALLVDDAQRLELAALRYIQLACRSGAMLRVVMAGPPGSPAALEAEELAPLRERIAHRVELAPLSGEEAGAFAGHLLRAGGVPAARAMTSAALDALVRHGWGNPGRIKALLRRALALGVASGEAPVRPETVEQAVAAQDGISPVPAPAPAPMVRQVKAAPRFARRRRELAWALAGLGIGVSLAFAAAMIGNPVAPAPDSVTAAAAPVAELSAGMPAVVVPQAAAPPMEPSAEAVTAPADAAVTPGVAAIGPPPDASGTTAVAALPLPPTPPQSDAPRVAAEPRRAVRATRTVPERATFDPRLDERRCRDIVFKAQLGEELTYGDRQFLRAGCRSGR